jgi:hypothetical protein
MLNWQPACRLRASVAVQLTVVCPIGNIDPDAGEQLTLTGVCPSRASGVGNEMAMPFALIVARLMPSSHDSVGPGGGGGGGGGSGLFGLLQPALNVTAMRVQESKRRAPVTDKANRMYEALHFTKARRDSIYLEENS